MLKQLKLLAIVFFTLFFLSARAQDDQDDITLELNTELSNVISEKNSNLEALKNEICSQVDQLSHDVNEVGDGSLSYPNWVRFAEIAQQIDSLNDVWNEAYGEALDNLIDLAIEQGLTNATSTDEHSKDLLSDIIEEDHLIFPADIASVCYEEKFKLNSLRKCLETQEEEWLEAEEGDLVLVTHLPLLRKLMMKNIGL